MNARERVWAVLNRKPLDRFPVDLWLTPEVLKSLMDYHGAETEMDLYRIMGIDKMVWVNNAFFELYPSEKDAAIQRNVWGVEMRAQEAGAATYYECLAPPLQGYDTPESLDDYPHWPDPDAIDYAPAAALAREVHGEFVTLGPWVSLFEVYCQLRGLQNAMMDVLVYPDLVHAVLDRVEAIQTRMMENMFDHCGENIDLVFISDDMAGQDNLLFSVETWDTFLKARLTRWCDMIHGRGMKVFYHTDGAAGDIIPRLIDAGIDVLNPIQHACPGMEVERLKADFGKRVVFHGGIENQDVLPFGTPDDVAAETRNCLDTLGGGGEGYIVCSCHNIQAGTPVENVLAMVETVHNHTPVLAKA